MNPLPKVALPVQSVKTLPNALIHLLNNSARLTAVGAWPILPPTERNESVSDDSDGIKQMARRAGVELPDERARALGGAVRNLERVARALAAIDYGEAEPAARFRVPGLHR